MTTLSAIPFPAVEVRIGDVLSGPGEYNGCKVEAIHITSDVCLHLDNGARVYADKDELVAVVPW